MAKEAGFDGKKQNRKTSPLIQTVSRVVRAARCSPGGEGWYKVEREVLTLAVGQEAARKREKGPALHGGARKREKEPFVNGDRWQIREKKDL